MVAFSLKNNTWVHLVALIAITLFADMFFQFDGSTMLGSMISVLMTIIMEPVGLYSFSLYRLVVIIALCIALLLVNSLVYPKSIPETLRKQLQYCLLYTSSFYFIVSFNLNIYFHAVLKTKCHNTEK